MELTTIFPSKYLKASDLQGKETTVKIARCEIEKMGEESKLVTYFEGKIKGLVTNRTNADRIAHLHGNDTDSWIGKAIVLYPDMVNFQGRVVEAVRVRAHTATPKAAPTRPQTPPPKMNGDMDDEIPF